MLSRNSFLKFVSHYPARHLTTDHHQALVAERSKALQLSCRGLAGRGFESRWRHIFILNFSLPPRSEQVNGAVANEIKHVHSPEVIVVLDPRYDLSYKALYISTCSIALSKIEKVPRGIQGEKSSKEMASSRKYNLSGGRQKRRVIWQ